MPFLGDFLGHILAEITIARTQADAEALRLAEIYARDPLLKHLPVPRFRLPTVAVRVPVSVVEMQEPGEGELSRGRLDPKKVPPAFVRALLDQARRVELDVPQSTLDAVGRRVKPMAKAVGPPTRGAGVAAVADDMIDGALEVLSEALERSDLPKIERLRSLRADLKEGVISEMIRLREPPPRLRVSVTTSELREAGPSLVNLELQISEDAVEWTTIESDGRTSTRLIPE